MKSKNDRLNTLRMLISSKELSCQDDVLKALEKEGHKVTQATLSRDMKQLKVAKATNLGGKYFYVLPNETMYKRVSSPKRASEMMLTSGFLSINFSANIGVIKTRPGYASSLAYNIDSSGLQPIIGTIAGDDTIFIVIREGADYDEVISQLKDVIPDIK
ncbi:MAG: arginine repressor [Prevotella sp.]|nr:arginine repressor [Prevotella sp.]